MRGSDLLRVMRHQTTLQQLKEIAKSIHVTANTLEDKRLKMVRSHARLARGETMATNFCLGWETR